MSWCRGTSPRRTGQSDRAGDSAWARPYDFERALSQELAGRPARSTSVTGGVTAGLKQAADQDRAVDAEQDGDVLVGELQRGADEVVAAVAHAVEDLRRPGVTGQHRKVAGAVERVVDAGHDVERAEHRERAGELDPRRGREGAECVGGQLEPAVE